VVASLKLLPTVSSMAGRIRRGRLLPLLFLARQVRRVRQVLLVPQVRLEQQAQLVRLDRRVIQARRVLKVR
jgi:hypothetical protein